MIVPILSNTGLNSPLTVVDQISDQFRERERECCWHADFIAVCVQSSNLSIIILHIEA